MLAMAPTASSADAMVGSSNATGPSRVGQMRSMARRSAAGWPWVAKAITAFVRFSAAASNRRSAATVRLLRAPRGRPAGLPLWPGWNFIEVLLGFTGGTRPHPPQAADEEFALSAFFAFLQLQAICRRSTGATDRRFLPP